MGVWDPDRWITDADRGRSRTTYGLSDLERSLESLRTRRMSRMLDIGCGYGGLPALVGDYLDIPEIHGIDIDPRVEEEARSKGVDFTLLNADEKPLPFDDGYFDFVMTLGMMDYLVSFDGVLREINRVLAPGGAVLITLPNLSAWHNRVALLMGYQPRDVEISTEVLPGVARTYRDEDPAGHIHIPTLRAFKELMDHHGFETVAVTSGRPGMRKISAPLEFVDGILSRWPSLARRFYYVGRKVHGSPVAVRSVSMPYQSLD